MLKCPYCGSPADRLELDLKAYVPVIVDSAGAFELKPYSGRRDREIWESLINCLDDEEKDVYCSYCGNISRITGIKEKDGRVYIKALKRIQGGARHE